MVIKLETGGWVGSLVRGGFMPGPCWSSFPGSPGAVWGMGWDDLSPRLTSARGRGGRSSLVPSVAAL